jgi:hypothetical protein
MGKRLDGRFERLIPPNSNLFLDNTLAINDEGEIGGLAVPPDCDVILAKRVVAISYISLYGECMARMISTTIRLNEEDVRALKRARAAGHSASELIRKGLRVVASRYYTGRRPPSTSLFESTDTKLGDESELFRNLED